MIGQQILHYRIIEKLGEGGMGVVYKAEDTKLKRTVALKFLPPELTRDQEARERFIHEAQAASALDHPNICTIHEVGETDDGQSFIAMACYEGETLKRKIERGPLKPEEAVEIAIKVGQGLARAHEAGIVHRDIKTANIMITDRGEVKIVDFGLAKLGGQAGLTRTGTILGTAAYMSPEQARGETLDHRTDIWSLGVVLYEMVTGQLPFKGENPEPVLYSIVHSEPQPVSRLRPDAPGSLSSVIARALNKDRTLRYQTANELVAELQRSASPPIELPHQDRAIVVLPFENLSPDPDQEYFSDGLTEEVISDLSNVRALRVISRSSAMTFKGTRKKTPEIARELSVQYVLEGSVRKAGKGLRITAQLIDAVTDAHIWAQKYSGTLDDVFDIQEKVSRAIVEALRLKLTPEEKSGIAARPIENAAAYECYLKARADIYRFKQASLDRAVRYLQKGIDMIGDNALLYTGMAEAYWQYVNIGVGQEEYIARAEDYVQRALTLDPDFPKAHVSLGDIFLIWHGDPQEAVRHFKRALAADPNETSALLKLAQAYTFVGRTEQALPLLERSKQIDPLNPGNYVHRSGMYFYGGQYQLALDQCRTFWQLDPENPIAHCAYASALVYNGEVAQALDVVDKSTVATTENVVTSFLLLLKYALLKDKERAFAVMTPEFRKTCARDLEWSLNVAVMMALLDAREEEMDWLESAVNRGFINYPLLAERDPILQNVRGEERFKKLLERVKYQWEHFEV